MFTLAYGDILDSREDVIVHQVNHQGKMGAGLAYQIRNKYPDLYPGYVQVCKNLTFKFIKESGFVYYYFEPSKIIASVFGQNRYGSGVMTDYVALENGLRNVARMGVENGLSIALPFGLGCGLAGGNWEVVYSIISSIFYYNDYTIYKPNK